MSIFVSGCVNSVLDPIVLFAAYFVSKIFFFYINFLDTIPIEKGGESIFTILETVYFVTFSMDKM